MHYQMLAMTMSILDADARTFGRFELGPGERSVLDCPLADLEEARIVVIYTFRHL